MFKISRYWNRLVYKLVDLARYLVWDYTGYNADILEDDFASSYTREMMTYIDKSTT